MLSLQKTILVFFLLCSSFVNAQKNCLLRFSGTVTDRSGDPIGGARVLLLPDSVQRIAGDDGRFTFDKICEGNHRIVASAGNYRTTFSDLKLVSDVERVISLEEDVTRLNEVVVTDKVVEVDHAQNFSVLSEKQLAASAGKSLGESLKEVPGVNTIQSGPGIFKPVIHGVHSQRILILNYGIRQEGQQWGAEHAPEIDPFVASNIVVIKDASAIKYGTDALGGVVVVNPSPLPERGGLGGSVNTIVQSNGRSGTISARLEGGIGKLEGWGWRVQGTARRSGDFHAPGYSLTNTGLQELNFSAATGYHAKNVGVEIFFSHFQTELGILKGTSTGSSEDLMLAMEREPPQYTSSFSYDIDAPRQEVGHDLLKLNGHIESEKGEWRFQYGYQNNQRREFDMRRGDLASKPALDLSLVTHTVETEREIFLSERNRLCVGITGMFQNNKNIPGTEVIPFIPNFTNQSAGAFAITKLSLDPWVIDLGVRYDFRHYNVSGRDIANSLYKAALNFQNVSATAGATVNLPHQQSLSLNISTAWRPPHVAELYSFGTHQSAAAIEYGLLLNDSTSEVMDIDDVDFKNEQALKVVATYSKEWKKLQLEVSGYVNYIANYIYLRPAGITRDQRGEFPYSFYTQTDALFTGIDAVLTWSLMARLKVIPKVSLLRATDYRNSDYLVFVPANRYEIAVRYEELSGFRLKGFFVESNAKYVARQGRAPRVITPRDFSEASESGVDPFENDPSNFDFMAAPDGYFLWNMSSGFTFPQSRVKYDFRIGVENILNTSYREYTNRFRYYADDLGRNFLVSVKCTF